MRKLITLSFLPNSYDFALLLLRVWFGLMLFYKHGIEKIFHFPTMAQHFPDPLHIGPHSSLLLAMISDGICSLLLVIGIATRWAALYCAIIIGTAFVAVHHFALSGPHSGELAYTYVGAALTIFFAGPGRFSIDGSSARKQRY
ncbi:MAG TPA: DoxX family protein [Bryobacteraceae bacterium]|jgi:putative oxidoreductase|nr:DoxX family protein [Bryobacteraceae bacterium]